MIWYNNVTLGSHVSSTLCLRTSLSRSRIVRSVCVTLLDPITKTKLADLEYLVDFSCNWEPWICDITLLDRDLSLADCDILVTWNFKHRDWLRTVRNNRKTDVTLYLSDNTVNWKILHLDGMRTSVSTRPTLCIASSVPVELWNHIER